MLEPIPQVPFPGFKWKWASLQPTESLNRPEFFLGVLRAMAKNEGRPKSDRTFNDDLKRVQQEIGLEGATLARQDPKRNIIRNAGQYWKVLGVLSHESAITLTPLGRLYADRTINQYEFALHIVLNLRLPSSVYSNEEKAAWASAGISFRPLLLILQIVAAMELGMNEQEEAYISTRELADIVQPLSAVTTDPVRIGNAILAHRSGRLDTTAWPKLHRESNDYRISSEFLLFLNFHGLLHQVGSESRDKKFKLGYAVPDDIRDLSNLVPSQNQTEVKPVVTKFSHRVERRKITQVVYARPKQQAFREAVLEASRSRCLITGTEAVPVLQAAHIRPVASEGSDLVNNGLCLRSDMHILYDLNRIRIRPDGCIDYADDIKKDPTYSGLPEKISIPNYVNTAELKWRWDFT